MFETKGCNHVAISLHFCNFDTSAYLNERFQIPEPRPEHPNLHVRVLAVLFGL
jgi:hypothetical protein